MKQKICDGDVIRGLKGGLYETININEYTYFHLQLTSLFWLDDGDGEEKSETRKM